MFFTYLYIFQKTHIVFSFANDIKNIQIWRKIMKRTDLTDYCKHLSREEKSPATIEKYLRDVRAFVNFSENRQITKLLTLEFKKHLIGKGYAVSSVNSILASMNNYLDFLEMPHCKVKNIKTQKQTFCNEEKILTKEEYLRLVAVCEKRPMLSLILQTICATGIRVSELQYFTVESIKHGEITVSCKNKTRTILIPGKLRKLILSYAKKRGITSGAVFVTKNGKALDRSNIWKMMKTLCKKACVNPQKVFPHNLRKLFARTFYKIEKDIAKLADILGHSSIETTRIYIMTSGIEHRKKIEKLGLII